MQPAPDTLDAEGVPLRCGVLGTYLGAEVLPAHWIAGLFRQEWLVAKVDAAAVLLHLEGTDGQEYAWEDDAELFNFLPDPELEDVVEGQAGPGPSTAAYRQMRRTLIEDEDESHVYQWHSTAGQAYRKEPTVHARWKSLFGTESQTNEEYQPFHSRLDWEMVQWAVKEKISLKSFNRLLKIPEVISFVILERCSKLRSDV